jgi:hypothetical protein
MQKILIESCRNANILHLCASSQHTPQMQKILHLERCNAKCFRFRQASIKIFCIRQSQMQHTLHFVQDLLHFNAPDQNPLDPIEFPVVGRVMQMRLRGVKEHARSSVLAEGHTIQGILHLPASNAKYFRCVSHKSKIFCISTASIKIFSKCQF